MVVQWSPSGFALGTGSAGIFRALAYCTSNHPNSNIRNCSGDKVVLSEEVIVELLGCFGDEMQPSPTLFQMKSMKDPNFVCHVGVLEYDGNTAKEVIYMPEGLMLNLELEEGDEVELRLRRLPTIKHLVLAPLNSSFGRLKDAQGALHVGLQNYTAQTEGDIQNMRLSGQDYQQYVASAVSSSNQTASSQRLQRVTREKTDPDGYGSGRKLGVAQACCIIDSDVTVEFQDVGLAEEKSAVKVDASTSTSASFQTRESIGAGEVYRMKVQTPLQSTKEGVCLTLQVQGEVDVYIGYEENANLSNCTWAYLSQPANDTYPRFECTKMDFYSTTGLLVKDIVTVANTQQRLIQLVIPPDSPWYKFASTLYITLYHPNVESYSTMVTYSADKKTASLARMSPNYHSEPAYTYGRLAVTQLDAYVGNNSTPSHNNANSNQSSSSSSSSTLLDQKTLPIAAKPHAPVHFAVNISPFPYLGNVVAVTKTIRTNLKAPENLSVQVFDLEAWKDQGMGFIYTAAMLQNKMKSPVTSPSSANNTKDNNSNIDIPADSYLCSSCMQVLPKSSRMLHEMRCANQRCECKQCKKALERRIAENHQHCFICLQAVDASMLCKHMSVMHQTLPCNMCHKIEVEPFGYNEHKSKCAHKVSNCKYCRVTIMQEEVETHQRRCGGMKAACDYCDRQVVRSDMFNHYAIDHDINPCFTLPDPAEWKLNQAIKESLKDTKHATSNTMSDAEFAKMQHDSWNMADNANANNMHGGHLCPVCGQTFDAWDLDAHLDECLQG